MPLNESQSIASRSNRHSHRKHKKINRKTCHHHHQSHRNHYAHARPHRNKLNYSPEYSQKPKARLYYSDEHKPQIEQDEETVENYDGFINASMVSRLHQMKEEESGDIIKKIQNINL